MSIELTSEYAKSPIVFFEKRWLHSPIHTNLAAKYKNLNGSIWQENQTGTLCQKDRSGNLIPLEADDKAMKEDCLELLCFNDTNDKIVYCDINRYDTYETMLNYGTIEKEVCMPYFSTKKPHVTSFLSYFLPCQRNRITYVTLDNPNVNFFLHLL